MTALDVIPSLPDSPATARDLPSNVLYALERAGDISRQILDDRVRAWKAAGWPQSVMATELGCSRQAISKRMARLGIEPAHPSMARSQLRNPVAQIESPTAKGLVDYLPDMLPGASPEGAFRQEVLAWCSQGHLILTCIEETGVTLVPKSDADRKALGAALAEIQTTAARLERQLEP